MTPERAVKIKEVWKRARPRALRFFEQNRHSEVLFVPEEFGVISGEGWDRAPDVVGSFAFQIERTLVGWGLKRYVKSVVSCDGLVVETTIDESRQ